MPIRTKSVKKKDGKNENYSELKESDKDESVSDSDVFDKLSKSKDNRSYIFRDIKAIREDLNDLKRLHHELSEMSSEVVIKAACRNCENLKQEIKEKGPLGPFRKNWRTRTIYSP